MRAYYSEEFDVGLENTMHHVPMGSHHENVYCSSFHDHHDAVEAISRNIVASLLLLLY